MLGYLYTEEILKSDAFHVLYKRPSVALAVTRHVLHHILETLCMSYVILLIQKVNSFIAVQIAISLHR